MSHIWAEHVELLVQSLFELEQGGWTLLDQNNISSSKAILDLTLQSKLYGKRQQIHLSTLRLHRERIISDAPQISKIEETHLTQVYNNHLLSLPSLGDSFLRGITSNMFQIKQSGMGKSVGKGLFTTNNHIKGETLLQITGTINSKAEDMLSFCLDDTKRLYLMPEGQGQYINHSCDPNCMVVQYQFHDKIIVAVHARKSIGPNSELTFDYQLTATSGANEPTIECSCKSKKCRGVLQVEEETEVVNIKRRRGLLLSLEDKRPDITKGRDQEFVHCPKAKRRRSILKPEKEDDVS
eukprot:TRINITY_DN5810_c0_g1_i1.p1 TRINITY_DN5810_c0_g1~~TRINITY_DN5810_c0_g1_i1.p1  ORF type:complete len:295 (-),score=37.46 TRINITY_DN5810_c0_g1_i1:163-1047(-)